MTDLASIAPTTTTEWVLVGFGAIVFVGLWCLFAWQVVRLVRWRRFTRDVESFLIYDYHDRLDGHARDGRPGDERTRVSLVLRDRVKLMGSDMLPRKIFAILGARIRRTVRPTPVWVVVVIALVVVVGVAGPTILGSMEAARGAARAVEAGGPDMAQALDRAEAPLELSLLVSCALALPLMLVVFVGCSPLSSAKRMHDVLRALGDATGSEPVRSPSILPAITGFSAVALLLVCSLLFLRGPHVGDLAAPLLVEWCAMYDAPTTGTGRALELPEYHGRSNDWEPGVTVIVSRSGLWLDGEPLAQSREHWVDHEPFRSRVEHLVYERLEREGEAPLLLGFDRRLGAAFAAHGINYLAERWANEGGRVALLVTVEPWPEAGRMFDLALSEIRTRQGYRSVTRCPYRLVDLAWRRTAVAGITTELDDRPALDSTVSGTLGEYLGKLDSPVIAIENLEPGDGSP